MLYGADPPIRWMRSDTQFDYPKCGQGYFAARQPQNSTTLPRGCAYSRNIAPARTKAENLPQGRYLCLLCARKESVTHTSLLGSCATPPRPVGLRLSIPAPDAITLHKGAFCFGGARKESNLRPLSYQDSVLPLNY